MKKRINLIFTLILAFVCCVCGQLYIMATSNSSAKASTLTESYQVGNGASIRVYGTDTTGYGIKFRATVPDSTKSYNMCIMPIDYYNYYNEKISDSKKEEYDYNIIKAIPGETGRKLGIIENCPYIDDNTIHGSIINILPSNVEREFIAIVYYVDNAGVYHFAEKADDAFRSIASVASRAINSQAYADDEDVLPILKNFVGEDNLIEVALPYYGDSDSNFFAYGGVGSKNYTIDLEKYPTGNDPLTLERLLEYKAAGFNILYSGITYDGEAWATSTMKNGMDLAQEAGLKVIVIDHRILNSVTHEEYFVSDETLDLKLASFIKDYAAHPAFYGISMRDEPLYAYAEKYGKVYKSLKRIISEDKVYQEIKNEKGEVTETYLEVIDNYYTVENPYLHCNLLPNYASAAAFDYKGFKAYLEAFIEATKDDQGNVTMDRLSIDVYPYRGKSGLIGGYYSGLQIFAETCRDYGVETTMVLQSYSGYDPVTAEDESPLGIKTVTVNDMYQQMNAALAMGITDFSFYTYYPRNSMTSEDGGYTDVGGFLTVKGNKTNVYYYASQAMKEAKAVTSIFNNYDYLGGNFYKKSGFNIATKYSLNDSSYVNTGSIGSVTVNSNLAYVSEFMDSDNSLYGYAVVNPYDEFSMTSTNDYSTNVTLTFDSGYDYVAEIYAGNVSYHKLSNRTFTKTLSVGDATYIIPLRSSVNTGIASIYGKVNIILADSNVYYQADESIDLYDLIDEQPNVNYTFKVNGEAVNGRTYFISTADTYNVTITATKGTSTSTATTTFTANKAKAPYNDRFDIIVSPTGISWLDMGSERYTVSIDGQEEIDVKTALSFNYATNGVSEGKHTVTLKGYLADGSYKETVKDIIYSPDGVRLVGANQIKEGSYLNNTSGSITYTSNAVSNRDASFITLNSNFTDEYIRIRFTALGANFLDSGLSLGIKNEESSTDVLTGWTITGNHAHGLMLNYGQNHFMNRINHDNYGEYEDVVGSYLTFNPSKDFVTGNEYSLIFGINGTGDSKVLTIMIIDDTSQTIVRHVTMSWAQITDYATQNNKTIEAIADEGQYTIYNALSGERSFSYEIIPYSELSNALSQVQGFSEANEVLSWAALSGAKGYMIKIGNGEWMDVGSKTTYSFAHLNLEGDQTASIKAYFEGGYTSKVTSINFSLTVYPSIGSGDDNIIQDIY